MFQFYAHSRDSQLKLKRAQRRTNDLSREKEQLEASLKRSRREQEEEEEAAVKRTVVAVTAAAAVAAAAVVVVAVARTRV